MKSFHWGAHFETGLTEVDKQHHHLVDIINQFGNLLAENVVHSEDVNSLYNQLADYAIYHFKEEEKNIDTENLFYKGSDAQWNGNVCEGLKNGSPMA